MILVDTGAWYALVNEADANHGRAAEFVRRRVPREFGQLITTNYVLAETLTLLRVRLGLEAVRRFVALLGRTRILRVFWVGEDRHRLGLDLMLQYRDKLWSFTDCTSFVLMRELDVADAFTFDENFAQGGFRIHP